jgi:hypothetical protein
MIPFSYLIVTGTVMLTLFTPAFRARRQGLGKNLFRYRGGKIFVVSHSSA